MASRESSVFAMASNCIFPPFLRIVVTYLARVAPDTFDIWTSDDLSALLPAVRLAGSFFIPFTNERAMSERLP